MLLGKKIAVVLPAYNAEKTLGSTYAEIPHDIVDEMILVDDNSTDLTLAIAKRLGIRHVIEHDRNLGYGGNQKTCYRTALGLGADIVIMLHPDYQYTPKLIRAMASVLAEGVYDVVLGSRILGAGARKGGMPLYKYVSNRFITAFENALIGQNLSDYHTGYRAYSRRVLETIPFEKNSNDFVFDNQILVQVHYWDFEIAELTCPTKYFAGASSINFRRSLRYGLLCCATAIQFRLQTLGVAFDLFDGKVAPSARRSASPKVDAEGLPVARWWLMVAVVAVLGFLLRYHDISRQILLDDEWHALTSASKNKALHLLTHYFNRATAIPLNVYARLALYTMGWSEWSVRVLSILSTGVTLVLFPWVVRRVFDSRAMGLVAAVVLAASPFWIFYAQSARPYAPYLMFLVATYYFFERAVRSSRFAPWVPFAICGALAAYFHLFAVPAVASLAVVSLAGAVVAAGPAPPADIRSRLRRAAFGFMLWVALTGALYVVPVLTGNPQDIPVGTAVEEFGPFWRIFAELLTGSRFQIVAWSLIFMALLGLVQAWRKNSIFVGALLVAFTAQIATTLITHPRSFSVPLVLLRYNITLYAAYFIGLCAFAERAAVFLKRRFAGARIPIARGAFPFVMASLGALLVFTSPIPQSLAARPNNFRLHSAFQESYDDFDPSQMYRTQFSKQKKRRNGVPEFYTLLERAGKTCRLVEYPLEMKDNYDPLYRYQYYHGCDVVGGYSPATSIGSILTPIKGAAKLRFHQLVDVEDIASVRATGADYVIVHMAVRNETSSVKPRHDPEIDRVLAFLEKELGAPTYKDKWLRVFALRR